ncbi:hypothetical protein EJB05_02451, partial [Eragrostis curvula]
MLFRQADRSPAAHEVGYARLPSAQGGSDGRPVTTRITASTGQPTGSSALRAASKPSASRVYCKALERLTAAKARARPHHVAAAARVLHGGALCFGLLDPVSNIIANTFFTPYENNNNNGVAEAAAGELVEDLELRSLVGLVTFLTRFFPYLADCEAVSYLLAADADALVAARIVVRDRRMARFGSSDLAVAEALEMSLKCAAMAAGHPDPHRLVGAWLAVSGRLDAAVALLAKVRRRRPSSILRRSLGKMQLLADGRHRYSNSNLSRPWQLAASRRPHPRRRVQPRQSISITPLKRVLLDAIHGYYLAALARLPGGELRRRLHRSVLVAGHCYGPLADPIANIIINAVWYDAAFPPRAHELELDMVSTLSLHRIGTRSMYGLVSFLCTRYHRLDFRHAVRLLVESDANLLLADPNLDGAAVLRKEERRRRRGNNNSPWSVVSTSSSSSRNALGLGVLPATGVENAFKAAAIAAKHPHPEAQAKLLASCKKLLGPSLSLLQSGGQLTSADVRRLARLLCPESPPSSDEQPLPAFPLKEYLRVHTRIVDKVVKALHACAPTYELHVVCGVNENVSGPVYCLGGSSFAPHKCYRCHVNFLATPKEGAAADRAPVLFFAELSNDEDDDGGGASGTLPLCCPVSAPPPCAERVRCLFCDYVGIRIVHPIETTFHGRQMEFENMVCGEDPFDEDFNPALMQLYYTNTKIVRHSRLVANGVYSLKEDCLYAESRDDDDEEEEEGDQGVVYGSDYDVYE